MNKIWLQLRFAVAIVLLALLAAFALQNMAKVELSFLHWTFQSRRIVIIGASLLIGLIVGFSFGYGAGRRQSHHVHPDVGAP